MAKESRHYMSLNNKKYFYTLKSVGKNKIHVVCEAAKIDQIFLAEDIPILLIDLPNLILAEKEYKQRQSEIIRFRLSAEDKKAILQKANKKGFTNISSFLRSLALNA